MATMPHLASIDWDYADRLQTADLGGGGTVYYTYDAEGNRARKVIENGAIKEERIYLGDWEIYRKTVSGTLDTERETLHISDDTGRIALSDTLTVDGGSSLGTPTLVLRYQMSNHLGSATLELDETAAIISYEEYHPFGTTSYRSGRNAAETSLKRYRYVGKERDDETGLYYYGARYYAAWLARFVSVDPLKDDYPHLTPYQYASNDPIGDIDIDGLQSAKEKPRSVRAQVRQRELQKRERAMLIARGGIPDDLKIILGENAQKIISELKDSAPGSLQVNHLSPKKAKSTSDTKPLTDKVKGDVKGKIKEKLEKHFIDGAILKEQDHLRKEGVVTMNDGTNLKTSRRKIVNNLEVPVDIGYLKDGELRTSRGTDTSNAKIRNLQKVQSSLELFKFVKKRTLFC